MDKKVAILAFNGEAICFAQTLLDAQDMKERRYDVKLTTGGSATQQVRELF